MDYENRYRLAMGAYKYLRKELFTLRAELRHRDRLMDRVLAIAEGGLDGSDLSDATVEALLKIIRLLDPDTETTTALDHE